MQNRTRNLSLCVCDYENNILCNLYDNTSDASGQATDVFVVTERNGWKELNFRIPSVCSGPEGKEENFRLQFLTADYRIRLVDDFETDWYLISEPKITHNNHAKEVDVRCGHISQLLKTKALDLEFSDEEANNVGTANQLLTTILEGTGWRVGNVENFYEDDKTTIKVRSLEAGTNTGAFKLIEEMCDLFDAKPVYHGDNKTVDIMPMNPFSDELEPGEIPKEVYNDVPVLEIHYDKNLKNITRTVNTENLVTRLYAYGSYGDENGMCSIQTCSHDVYTFRISQSYPVDTQFSFRDKDGALFFFRTSDALTKESHLEYSKLDFASRSYVWNYDTETAYHIYKEPSGEYTELSSELTTDKNYFPFLLCFDYYSKTGLLSENMFQQIATYQHRIPEYYKQSEQAAKDMIANEQLLSETLESNTGMLKLAVQSYGENIDGSVILRFDVNQGDHGVLYRTDYDEAKRNYFEWHVAKQLKNNGDPVSGIGSVVYIIHDTNPVTWEIAYVKNIINDNGDIYVNDSGEPKDYDYGLDAGEPAAVSLWLNKDEIPALQSTDRFYLFCSMSMSGKLSAKQVSDEAVLTSLQNETTISTETHPTYFAKSTAPVPSVTPILNSYGWYYKYYDNSMQNGDLYFCNGDDSAWHYVHIEENTPTVINDDYYFNVKYKTLWHGENGEWIQMKTAAQKRIAVQFSKVIYYCRQRDMIYKGLYEKYTCSEHEELLRGNYAIKSPYDFYWVFTTDRNIDENQPIVVDTTKGYLYQDSSINNIVSTKVVSTDACDFPVSNELLNVSGFPGDIDSSNGTEITSSDKYRTNNIFAYEETNYEYKLPSNSAAFFYNVDRVYKGATAASGEGSFLTPEDTKYIRIVSPVELDNTYYLRIRNYDNVLYLSNKQYMILSNTEGSEELVGISPLMRKFAELADTVYEVNYRALIDAQNAIKEADNNLTDNLGDLLREGYWQENNYVEGDEAKLYKDAIDNLKEISQPETTYDISYLDLYDSNKDMEFGINELSNVEWPDVQITDAIHLVDSEIDVNCWAYIDKLNKCYDQPWKTTLEINTKLSLIDQHDFTDVLSRIADVASETKAKQSIYKRSAALSPMGTVTSDRLEGNIKANKALLLGGSSNWYTDPKGNIIFEAEDGSGALMLTGRGLLIANSRDEWGDWNWRTGATGSGFTADEITTGFLSATLIEAGSITTDKLSAVVGQELEIGSNKSLMLYATIDGSRPAGGLKTWVHNPDGTYSEVGENDSYIQISSKDGDTPAYLNVMTGGILNIYSGSDMNIKSGADLNIENQGTFTVLSGGDMKIASGGSIEIIADSNGKFVVSSPNFNVKANGDVDITGEINALSGEIAGFTIKRELNQDKTLKRGYIYSGTDSMSSTAPGIYLGTDGVNLGGYLKVSKDGTTATFGSTKLVMDAVAGKVDLAGGDINITADSNINISSGKHLTILSSGDLQIGNIGNPFTVGSDGTNAFIYNGRNSVSVTNKNGCYYGTDGLNIGKSDGSYVIAKADGTIDISGRITATSGAIGGINVDSSKGMYTGSKNSATSTESGFYFDKSGAIYLGAYNATNESCPFQVTSSGALTATSGTIGGWTIGAATLTGNKTGLAKTTNDTDIAFWAGHTTASSAKFYVRQDGYLKASDIHATGGAIGAWTIGEKLLSASSGTSYVALDGSTDLYPLSGLSTPADHMYAMWAGGTSPNNAPFSVTKDGIVTIKTLRVQTAEGKYDSINLWNFIYAVTSTGDDPDFDVSNAFGKLKFQTVKSIRVNDTTGQVTINITNSSGGTSSVGFNSAASVFVEGSWNGAKYTARPYRYNKDGVKVAAGGSSDSTTIYGGWENPTPATSSFSNYYIVRDVAHGNQLLTSEAVVVTSTYDSNTHKYNVYARKSTSSGDVIYSTTTDMTAYSNGWDYGQTRRTRTTGDASSTDVTTKTLDYNQRWKITDTYTKSNGSTFTVTYVVASKPNGSGDVTISSITRSGATITATASNGATETLTLTEHTNCKAGVTGVKVSGNWLHDVLYYRDGKDSQGRWIYKEAGGVTSARYWYYSSTKADPTTYYD